MWYVLQREGEAQSNNYVDPCGTRLLRNSSLQHVLIVGSEHLHRDRTSVLSLSAAREWSQVSKASELAWRRLNSSNDIDDCAFDGPLSPCTISLCTEIFRTSLSLQHRPIRVPFRRFLVLPTVSSRLHRYSVPPLQ